MGLNAHSYLILEWILFLLSAVCAFGRFGVRAWRGVWYFWLSDIMIGLALLCFATLVIGDAYTIAVGLDSFGDYYNEGYAKWAFASSVVFDVGFFFPRFSLLAFYHNLFPASQVSLRTCLLIVDGFTVACFLTTICVDIFWCGTNVYLNWSNDEGGCALDDTMIPLGLVWGIGIFCEVLIFLLPLPLLRTLKSVPKRERVAITGMFMFSIITLLVSTTRFIMSVQNLYSYDAYLVGSGEYATQIIVASLPVLKPLLGFLRNLRPGWPARWFGATGHTGTDAPSEELKHLPNSASVSVQTGTGEPVSYVPTYVASEPQDNV